MKKGDIFIINKDTDILSFDKKLSKKNIGLILVARPNDELPINKNNLKFGGKTCKHCSFNIINGQCPAIKYNGGKACLLYHTRFAWENITSKL